VALVFGLAGMATGGLALARMRNSQ
jgi:hypothetical protein